MKEGSRLLIEQLDGVIGELALKESSRSWKGKIMASGKESSNDRVINEKEHNIRGQAVFVKKLSNGLEEIVMLLERGDTPLEQSMTLFARALLLRIDAQKCLKK